MWSTRLVSSLQPLSCFFAGVVLTLIATNFRVEQSFQQSKPWVTVRSSASGVQNCTEKQATVSPLALAASLPPQKLGSASSGVGGASREAWKTADYNATLLSGAPALDGEGQPCTTIKILLPRADSQVDVPIEKLYPNLRNYQFERSYKQNPKCFDCAGNALTRQYLVWMPHFVDVPGLYNRRIFLDLGAGSWGMGKGGTLGPLSQAEFFGSRYPNKKRPWAQKKFWHEYHTFDFDSKFPLRVQDHSNSPGAPATLFVHHNMLVVSKANTSDVRENEIDISGFILSNFTKDDFVSVKMDIENWEWVVIPDMIQRGAMDLVDELTVEIHFLTDDPGWSEFIRAAGLQGLCQSNGGCHTLHQAFDLLSDLRASGVYAHTWP
mmetsp:Transcript_34968/g.68556  ORF Transcript_34968/g.68556 Transcript_34968/m.68556 type:complete len:379 (+) Transcript_34968:473-1609(+)